MLAPDTILQDRYRILRLLGQGGMGAVYEAIDQRLDTTVALKETLFVEEKLRKQFEREARLLARLHHPALPRVSDHFAESEGAFLVMQFIAGDDLAGMITRRRGPFPQEQVLLWADQLLDALDYLHTQDPQIIHRDIKPQNLKLSSRGQIILLDFGLAKGQLGELSRATTSASIYGYTPNYAPLEQIQGLGTDPRSDIYALAATLYHLLTSVKPPDALTRAAAIVNGQPDPLQSAEVVNGAVSPQLAAVLQRAMSQNREQRYSSAAEMRKALQTSDEVTVRAGGEAATVLFSPARTNLGVANPTAQATMAQTSETTVVQAPSSKSRAKPWAIAAGVLLFAGLAFGAFYAYEKRSESVPSGGPVPPNVSNSPPIAAPSPSIVPEKRTEITGISVKKDQAANTAKETKKKPDTARKNEKTEDERAAEERAAEEARAEARDEAARAARQRDKIRVAPPDIPDTPEYIEVPGPNGRGRRRVPTVRTRTLPDGRRVMVTPNGTRIVTMPDGSTRVFGPGRKGKPRP